jgi:hypothetical protein
VSSLRGHAAAGNGQLAFNRQRGTSWRQSKEQSEQGRRRSPASAEFSGSIGNYGLLFVRIDVVTVVRRPP